jgi:hypothetical protein
MTSSKQGIKMQNNKDIDWLNTVNTDDIDMALDPLKGVTALLQALELAQEVGVHKYEKEGYCALGVLCYAIIDNIESMKPKVEYMDSKMREVKNG